MSDFWDDAQSALTSIAPTLATLIGGPLAGSATTLALKALGLQSDAKPAEMVQAIANATPEQLLALKQVEAQLTAHLADTQLATVKLDYDDVANARAREMTVKDHTNTYLAYTVTVLYFAAMTTMMFREVPQANHDILTILIGGVSTVWLTAMAYYFGSSRGSAMKSQELATKRGPQ